VAIKSSYWIDEVTSPGGHGATVDHVLAARVAAAIEPEWKHPWRRTAEARGDYVKYESGDLRLFAIPDVFQTEPANALLLEDRQGRRLGVADIVNIFGLPERAQMMLHSAAANMTKTADKIVRDPRTWTLDHLTRMPQKELYLLFERDGMAERHQRYSIGHVFLGDPAHHPYLGNGPVRVGMTGTSANVQHHSLERHQRHLPPELLLGGLPTHPQSAGMMRDVGLWTPYRDLWPTTSVRTLYDLERDLHLKTSYDAQITSIKRQLGSQEGEWGLPMSDLLLELADHGALPEGVHILPELHWATNGDVAGANALVRGGLQDIRPRIDPTDRVVTAAALTTRLPFTDGKSLLELIVERHGLGTYKQIADMQITKTLEMLDRGISHEGHGQNMLLIFNHDFSKIKGICLRDLPSAIVDLDRLNELFAFDPGRHIDPNRPEVVRDRSPENKLRRTVKFSNDVLESQVMIAAGGLVEMGLWEPHHARNFVRDRTRSAMTEYADGWLEPYFYRSGGVGTVLTGATPFLRTANNGLWGRPVREIDVRDSPDEIAGPRFEPT
jgi:hypothetical protein